MKIVKLATQNPSNAFETLYIIKGIFRKRVYFVDSGYLWPVPNAPVGGKAKDEKETV